MKQLGRVCFFAGVFVFFVFLLHRIVFQDERTTTIQLHIDYAKALYHGTPVKYVKVPLPHRGFFHSVIAIHAVSDWSFETSAVLLLSAFAMLTAIVKYMILRRALPDYTDWSILPITAMLMTASAIYVPFFNKAIYFGQGSPNIWHSATVMMLKPVALLAFYLIVNQFRKRELHGTFSYQLFCAVVVASSVYVKPTFLVVLLPAVGIYLLPNLRTRPVAVLRSMLVLLPACVVLMLQYATVYESSSNAHHASKSVGIVFFTVWRMFTPNILVSVVITIAFPLLVLLFRFRAAVKDPFLVLAWIMTLIGMVQFAFLGEFENGVLLLSANWIGGYLMGLNVLFVFSTIEFFRWLPQRQRGKMIETLQFGLVSTCLMLHVCSGTYYFYELLVRYETTLVWYT